MCIATVIWYEIFKITGPTNFYFAEIEIAKSYCCLEKPKAVSCLHPTLKAMASLIKAWGERFFSVFHITYQMFIIKNNSTYYKHYLPISDCKQQQHGILLCFSYQFEHFYSSITGESYIKVIMIEFHSNFYLTLQFV